MDDLRSARPGYTLTPASTSSGRTRHAAARRPPSCAYTCGEDARACNGRCDPGIRPRHLTGTAYGVDRYLCLYVPLRIDGCLLIARNSTEHRTTARRLLNALRRPAAKDSAVHRSRPTCRNRPRSAGRGRMPCSPPGRNRQTSSAISLRQSQQYLNRLLRVPSATSPSAAYPASRLNTEILSQRALVDRRGHRRQQLTRYPREDIVHVMELVGPSRARAFARIVISM